MLAFPALIKRILMTQNNLSEIAEGFLEELITAEIDKDYDKYVKNFDSEIDNSFTKQKFLTELEEMNKEMGVYKRRQYLCSLNDFKPDCTRFVWKVSFEKGETIVVIGLVQKDDTFKINEHYYY
jgi:hypothetical protein